MDLKKLDAYSWQQFRKNHRLVCPYCMRDLNPLDPPATVFCCGKVGHGEWMDTCGSCEEVITSDEEAYWHKHGYWRCAKCCENNPHTIDKDD